MFYKSKYLSGIKGHLPILFKAAGTIVFFKNPKI